MTQMMSEMMSRMTQMGQMMPGWGWMMGMMLLWGLVLLVLAVLAVIGIVWFVRNLPTRSRDVHQARAELDLRYARGEIGRDDYLQRRADLTGT